MFEFELEEKPKVTSNNIWVEKYRPKVFGDYIGSEQIKESFDKWITAKEVPHLIFHSSPGTGKTSLAKIILDSIKCDSLVINASDENSVDNIRNKVQDFAMTMGIAPLKIIFLDEADRITVSAQDALRNIMETYSGSTRFILTANHLEKITPAIKSRCQDFEIKPPSMSDAMKHLIGILDKEKVEYAKEDVAFIIKSYFPDLRKIINYAQQSVIDGKLKLAKAKSIDNDYREKLVELLKGSKSDKTTFTQIRQLVADASFSNYEEVYKYLFTVVDVYAGPKAAEVILALADAVYQNALVFEREITFVATMHKIITILKS